MPGEFLTVVSMEDVVTALHNTLGKKGMSDGDIRKLAEYLMSFFGYTDEVIDNKLTSEDRDVFYMLEEEGFLTTTQEEVHLKKGKLWRIHYWILKKDQILRLSRRQEAVIQKKDESSAVYDEISEEQWSGRK
jgi:hypothetical protein